MLITDLIQSHPYWAIALGAGTILASEVIWGAIKYPLRLIGKLRPPRVHEVVFFNELVENCYSLHYNNIRSDSEGSMEPDSQCANPYCTIKGIGKMVKQIDQAVYAVDIAIYTFTSMALCEALKRALHRGVSIRIISDREMVFSSGSQINLCADLGVPVRGPTTTFLMHHKFLVIDGVERVQEIQRLKQRKWMQNTRSVLISGSVNWTRMGFGGNWENCIITDDKVLAGAFQAEFNRMWKAFKSLRE
ncbi:mitochondrial cardiolipin hydrolase [Drosophila kikkawai]|uniref:Mitochondrial cardiolipin hydrolase n=1 Tax=Drosophila kikkawai TaxID=30033 RepID=A0A6P4ILH0_DROKI|nr:mitochondrial cardiolipin hydrolase [Drosophila kikkawai]